MSQRCVCSAVGTMAQPLPLRMALVSRGTRGFHVSARRLEDQPRSSSPSTAGSAVQREPRRQRNANAANQIGNLQFRRAPMASGIPNGQNTTAGSPPNASKIISPRKPLVRQDSNGAPGTMVRAPSTLRISRTTGPGARPQTGPNGRPTRGGPNLRGRTGPPGASRGKPGQGGQGPPKRRRVEKGAAETTDFDPDVITPAQIDGPTAQLLYRLQRQQWDRKQYTPKYAPGSFEANELVHWGRELFRGESPPVKIWGKLERTLGVVGMHGAHGKLQIRRVPDGDDKPFGQEQ